MKLRVLVDNNTLIDQYFLGEPALCFYIEDEGIRLLFDVGYSEAFLRNAEKMGIPLNSVEKIVISHGHDDHTRGLVYFFKEKNSCPTEIIAHPDAFHEKRYEGERICSPYLEDDLKELCKLTLSKDPLKISENIYFLGEVPSRFEFERRTPIGRKKEGSSETDDLLFDDTGIVYKSEAGIVVITGCSHSGICSIIEYAREVCDEKQVRAVIGGFHLFENNDRANKTIDYLRTLNIECIYPCHCTSLVVKAEMLKSLPLKEVGVGLELNW